MDLSTTLVLIGCLIGSIILHELSHGVVALWFGDPTARNAGRLTLNPLPHIDPLGSVIVPGLLVLAGAPAFGWAKPVPVDPRRLRRPRAQMLLVALAGPGSNLLLMLAGALLARAAFDAQGTVTFAGEVIIDQQPLIVQVPLLFAFVNLLLGVFNLLPVPPLDGSALVERLLPARALPAWHTIRPYGLLVLLLLVFSTGALGRILDPFVERLSDFVLE